MRLASLLPVLPVLLWGCGLLDGGDKKAKARPVPTHRSFGSGTIADVPPIPEAATVVESGPRHVVIVSIDTLRADHLGCYGSTTVQTPNIDALCAESVVFDHHISAAPTTLASHTSLFTGKWPHHHGVSRNGFKMSDANVMLAEVLRRYGFVNAAFIAAFPLDPRFGLNQGFHLYEASPDEAFVRGENQQAQRDGDRVTDAALAFAATRDPSRERLFMFVHYFDAHAPYDADPRWKALYPDPPGERSTDGSLRQIKKARRQLEKDGHSPLSAPLRRAYAAGVSQADHELGRLIAGLGPMLDDTLLIVTADHGESFEEAGEFWNHGYSVHDATVRTPLIVRGPGLAPGRSPVLVSNIDVFPTVLAELGLPPQRTTEGASLHATLRGDTTALRDHAFAEATKPYSAETDGLKWRNARKCRAARSTTHKRLRCPYSETTALYALPDEDTDISAENGALVDSFDEAIDDWEAGRRPLRARSDKTPSVEKMLQELGYLEDD